MKKLNLIFAAAAMAVVSCAQNQPQEPAILTNTPEEEEAPAEYQEPVVFTNEDVTFRQIDEHTWEGNGNLVFGESLYIIEGEDRALLIDAGTRIADLDKIVAGITSKPVTLMATHVHGDHTGSAINYFPEIWINAADMVGARTQMRNYKGEIKFLTDGEVIDLGGRQIEVIFTPGHTPGSTSFFDKEKHYGFSGDAFGSTNLLLQTNFSTLLNTASRIARYMQVNGIEKMYSGHYHGHNPETLQRVLDLKSMAEEMLEGRRVGEVKENARGLNAHIHDHGVTVQYRYPEGVK
ncbi:MAG: MBL fold metallo-hydrolase [Bacteroidales bacterium]|nr:MBL fold metallo-hydrolase [Bacteroidales bacterium]